MFVNRPKLREYDQASIGWLGDRCKRSSFGFRHVRYELAKA
jgi:hypothetical protein